MKYLISIVLFVLFVLSGCSQPSTQSYVAEKLTTADPLGRLVFTDFEKYVESEAD